MIDKEKAETIAKDYLQNVLEHRSDQIRAHPRVTWEVVTPTYSVKQIQRLGSVWVITFALDPVNQGGEPFLYVNVDRETGESEVRYLG
jgi:hypothetical protein